MAKSKQPNLNNPFVLLQVILVSIYRLIVVILTWIVSILILAMKHWVATLLILSAIFITLYTLGVL